MANDFWSAQLRAREVSEQTGLTLREIASLPLDEWARLTHGKTAAEAAHEALRAQAQYEEPQPNFTETVTSPNQPQGVDVASMDMATYAEFRAQLGIGQPRQEGIGLLNQGGLQSWAQAAQAKAGRTAMGAAGKFTLRSRVHSFQRPPRTRAAPRHASPHQATLGRANPD